MIELKVNGNHISCQWDGEGSVITEAVRALHILGDLVADAQNLPRSSALAALCTTAITTDDIEAEKREHVCMHIPKRKKGEKNNADD